MSSFFETYLGIVSMRNKTELISSTLSSIKWRLRHRERTSNTYKLPRRKQTKFWLMFIISYCRLTRAQWDTGLHEYLSHPFPSSVEANTDVIHNQRQKTLKIASVLLLRHILNTKSWLECCFSLLNSWMWPGIVRVFTFSHFSKWWIRFQWASEHSQK